MGQGNSALIQFPGKERMLIDGGGFRTGSFDVGRMVVAPFLLYSKILHIDYLVLSHPHPDHMNGLRFIASHFRPKEFWCNGRKVETSTFKELMKIIGSKKTKVLYPDELLNGRYISGVRIELLHPPSGNQSARMSDDTKVINNDSRVLKISYQGKSFLFPGDIEMSGGETVISNAGPALKSDILLAPHHGSKYSCTTAFLRTVRPEICVISCGSGNYSGFPHKETLEKLTAIGCRILRIDKLGAVQISGGVDRLEAKSYIK
ncbi:ComEC/Rec2 family competence protein [Thermodesulfobacteriota bacterium]